MSDAVFLFVPVVQFESAAVDEEQLIREVEMRSDLYDTFVFNYGELTEVSADCRELNVSSLITSVL